MHRSGLALLGMLLIGAASTPALAGPNLLLNPGFEAPLKGHPWMPAAWDTFESNQTTVFFGRDTFMVHGGKFAVSVANVSTLVPLWHNWSQIVLVGKEAWNKDAVFTVWTRSNGLQGRAYVLAQAYRDTITRMSRTWKVPRDTAMARLGITRVDDPNLVLGWKREYFSDAETPWVKRELRIFVPPSTNLLVVRAGLFGTGQVLFDDASLTLEPAKPAPPLPLNTNLLTDPGFEGDGNAWEYSMPPYENLYAVRDTVTRHTGAASVRFDGTNDGWVEARAGVCQAIVNRDLGGKRLRLKGWVKTDSLAGLAYTKIYFTTLDGSVHDSTPRQFGQNTPWTEAVMEVDAPPGTYIAWPWFVFNVPATGRVWFDDISFEITGPADYVTRGTKPPKAVLPGTP
jgi:hypothetical protein